MQLMIETDDPKAISTIMTYLRNTNSMTLIETKGIPDEYHHEPIQRTPTTHGHAPEYRRKQGLYAGAVHAQTPTIKKRAANIYKRDGIDAALAYVTSQPKPTNVVRQHRKNGKSGRKKPLRHRKTCRHCNRGYLGYSQQRYCSKPCADRHTYELRRDSNKE